MGSIDPKFLATIWTVLTFLFSAGIAYGTMRLTLRHHTREISEIKARQDKHELTTRSTLDHHEEEPRQQLDRHADWLKSALYRASGVTNYLPREECEQCRVSCQSRLDARLETMQRMIEEGERKREASKDQWAAEFKKIAQSIGRLEGKLGNGNGGA